MSNRLLLFGKGFHGLAALLLISACLAQGAIPRHQADGRWITEWLVLDRYMAVAEDRSFLETCLSSLLDISEGQVAWRDAQGGGATWRRVRVPGEIFPLRSIVGPNFSGRSGFLMCQLVSNGPDDVEFRLQTGLDVTVWLNGKELPRGLLLHQAQFSGPSVWGTRLLMGHLEAGTNQVLLRAGQMGLDGGLALRVFPSRRTVLSGRVYDSAGQPIVRDVVVAAFQGGRELERIGIDDSGAYHLSLLLDRDEPCDISFTVGDQGCWWPSETLRPGERSRRDAHLRPAENVSGSLMMLDQERSPQREITVQAVRDGVAVASVLSDEKGHYRFINLRPGKYQVRCLTPQGFRYCHPGSADAAALEAGEKATVAVEVGVPVRNLDARFAAFKKGVWRHFDTLDGVPNNGVKSLVCAPGGGLWIQTAGGLGFHDGSRFSTIRGTETMALTAMAAAADGTVWFGTYSGLFKLSGGVLTNFTVGDGLPDNTITSLLVSRSGELWVGTGYGLVVYDGKRFRTYTAADGLARGDITALGQTPDGAVWVGTLGGVARFDGRQFRHFAAADGLGCNEVTALECSDAKRVRVATVGCLAEWNGDQFRILLSGNELLPRRIRAMHAAPDGRLWLGTPRGVSVLHGQQLINYQKEDGVGTGDVNCITATPEGFLWFATDGGVGRLDPNMANYSTKDGLADNRIFDLCNYKDDLWIGMQWGGVGRYDGREFKTILPGYYARRLHRTSDGVLWIGCDKGALRFDGRNLLPGGLLTNHWVMAIASDENDVLWFGDGWQGGGVVRMQPNPPAAPILKQYLQGDGLTHDQVNCILCLPGDEIWVGTPEGLCRFVGGRIQAVRVGDGLLREAVRSLYQSRDGDIWVGSGGRLLQCKAGKFRDLTAEFGLPVTRIGSIYQSRDGLMWFGTETRGVLTFDGRAFSSFDTRDGLAGNSILAIAEDASGQMWFGTAKDGLTCHRRRTVAPSVRFTLVKAGGRNLPRTSGPIRLRAEEPATFSFESMDWISPAEKRQFRIRLRQVGHPDLENTGILDTVIQRAEFDWTPVATGDYTIEVESINHNLVYSEAVSLAVSVFRPWHERNVWRVPMWSLGLALVALVGRQANSNRTQRRAAEEKLRESERMFRSLIEVLPVPIYLSSGAPGHSCEYLNPALTRLTGYTSVDLPDAACWWNLAFPDPVYRDVCRQKFQKHTSLVTQTGAAQDPIEMSIVCRDGSQRVFALGFGMMPGGKDFTYALDLTERKAAEVALVRVLAERTQEWREATSAALAASDEEARRIGRELHDTLCQDLIGVARQAEALALVGVGTDSGSDLIATRLRHLASLASAAARQSRGLSHLLAVSEPLQESLEETLQGHVRQLEALYGFTCEISWCDPLPGCDPEQGMHLIRIVREALVNAARHARARRIWVDCLTEETQTILSISSDGSPGEAPQTWRAGLGLRQMRMRAALMGATITFRPGVQGAVVQLILPRPVTEANPSAPADSTPIY